MNLVLRREGIDMEKKLKYPEHPELEQGNYEAQAEAQIAQAEKLAELQENRAKRDRDMALIGDMAGLFAKGAAMHGGAWKINKDESQAAKGNEKLRALQNENVARLAEYAKMRVAARDAQRKERNAQRLAQYNAEVEAYKSAVEAEKYAKEQERKDKQDALKEAETASTIAKNRSYANYYNSGGKKTSGGGSGVNRDVFIVKDDGTKEYFRHVDDANNVQAAYARLPKEYRVEKEVRLYDEDDMGKPVLRIDAEGMPVTRLVENTKPTLGEMRQAISNYNNRELVEDWTPEEDEIIDYEP